MHILVTGGGGYIGSHTCKALAKAGYSPVVYDNLSTGHRDLVRWGEFVHGDILDTIRLTESMRRFGVEGVIHFAAFSQVGESVLDPGKYYQNNVAGTLSILQAMRMADITRIVVSSTCAIYGLPAHVPMNENTPVKPINPYGKTKAVMEAMLRDYNHAYGLKGAALRYFNAAGCDPEGETGERHDPETHLIPNVMMAGLGLLPTLEIYGDDYSTPDGTCVRDFIHVSDLADAHVRALEILDAYEVLELNLGTGHGFSIKEILGRAESILGREIPHRYMPRRPGDPPQLVADANLALRLLDWKPYRSDLDTILRTTMQWLRKDKAVSTTD